MFTLTLFSTKPSFISLAVAAGVGEIIVDWEWIGKVERQTGADTEIAGNVPADLRRVRAATEARVICRINGYGPTTPGEIEEASDAGADEILLPMVRSLEEVQIVFQQVDQRCGVGILIETAEAVSKAKEFSILPLSRIYVGLNDLAIELRQPNIFSSLIDGTVERIRRPFRIPFGFGGLTLPECGHPIPCRLPIGEMARMDCSFSFLRRSFHRDIAGRDILVEVPRIVILRIFSAYGYWESPTRLIPTAIMTAFENGKMDLTAPGYRRDFVFIEDVVDACLLAINAEDPRGEIINIGSGQQATNEEAVEAIQEITGRTIRVRAGSYPARASDTSHWVADIQRARLLLGWEPRHTLHQGLAKTVAWLHLHREMYHRYMQRGF